MNRIVYLNGKYVPDHEATVSIFDRGFLMADGVYEATAVLGGRLVDFQGHMKRLERSLHELEIRSSLSTEQWLTVHRELIDRNQIRDGMIYLQVTRGNPGDRDFRFPADTIPTTLVAFTQSKPDLVDSADLKTGWKVISIPDLRWGRRDIKTTQLLYPSMGKMMAVRAGVQDAWFVQDGFVTEGTSNNAYIMKAKQLITRHLSSDILHGITRTAVLQFAEDAGLEIVERPFSIREAKVADEAFVTSATAFVMPVVEIDGHLIGHGRPGSRTVELRSIYIEQMRRLAI